ncbi:formimidoylglutamase [Paenibacillus sp. E194]|uniref:formimidoylglutamase n=1 Tax=Paenibacillus sp. E194 TaxID=1458845 RepID=UPI001E4142AA|nr:formimidoylglutamase [Paenibacillus sp. E194]
MDHCLSAQHLFECEEGVRRNQGRLGAANAPNAIRQALASLPWRTAEGHRLVDAGNVTCSNDKLEEAQAALGHTVSDLLSKSSTPIIFGGGHETLYGHYLGVRQHIGLDASLGIINIDAHFDLHPYDTQPSSGTMFRQILEQDRNSSYFVLGIQRFGNTQELFDKGDDLGTRYILEEDMYEGQIDNIISSAHKKTLSFDICEVNPAVDENGRTIKLGAYLTNEAIMTFMGRNTDDDGA